MIEDTLKRAEVFLGLDDSDLSLIAQLPSSHQDNYPAGHTLFRAGEEAKYIYVLDEGLINIVVDILSTPEKVPSQITVDVITKGDFFGWSALVKPNRYILSAICQKPCRVTRISGPELISLCNANYNIGYKIFLGLSQIIGTTFRDLQQVLIAGKRWPFIEKHSGT